MTIASIRSPLLAVLLAGAALAGCTTSGERAAIVGPGGTATAFAANPLGFRSGGPLGPVELTAYAAVEDGGFSLPAIPVQRIDPQFLRQRVVYDGQGFEPGTVVVDTGSHFLYVVEPSGTAMRYGIGIGKAGFDWSGEAYVRDKQHWPRWFPPKEMIERRPELAPYGNEVGMDSGLMNPLGARALYLWQGNKDTLYRLHGTPEWWSIGKSVSSGCIRLMNQDVMDLYERVPLNARVIVLNPGETLASKARVS
ncbi:L,D-transpeptidase [Aureimonas mangrovi]|uniref:L,D-transpeptidase n=1 Tax=Aureimonas mangrovi TaxID=2758041 RepID=UPI00163DD1D9|nr:L,D-transpeptidase [Aureimonas mangrovi]